MSVVRSFRGILVSCILVASGPLSCHRGDSSVESKAKEDAELELPSADYEEPIGPEPPPVYAYHVGEVRQDDAFASVMRRLSVTATQTDVVVRSLSGLVDFTRAHPGDLIEIRKDAEGALEWLRYTQGPEDIFIAFRGSDETWLGQREPVFTVTRTVFVQAQVAESLYQAVEDVHEQPWLTLTVVELFAWDVDFFTETQPGDQLRALFEKKYVQGEFVGYGNVLAAEYDRVSGQHFSAFRYVHASGKVGYYRPDGTAVERAFVRSPIKFASITSRYGLRRHPILKYVRRHRGVDYGAPHGTAVWSVGKGTVQYAGWNGGYGRVVYVRHANGLETRYAHLSRFGRGIRSGVPVAQKRVIGYVGKSGLATGPHLHFEVLRRGRHLNPLSLIVPPAPPIPPEELGRFHAQVDPMAEQFSRPETVAGLAGQR